MPYYHSYNHSLGSRRGSKIILVCSYLVIPYLTIQDFVFPNGVAYPIGGRGEQYIVLETHYDNPNTIEGMVDNSGLEFFYSHEAPEKRAGLLTLGQLSSSSLIIPPRTDNFVVNALCPEQCTQQVCFAVLL